MSITLTQEEFNDLFKPYPQVRKTASGDPSCAYCGNGLTPEGLRYWDKATEAGTGFTDIEIQCDVCSNLIWKGYSWYSPVEDRAGLIYATEESLREEKGEWRLGSI